MNYKLALKLKKAGFPQTGLSGRFPSKGPSGRFPSKGPNGKADQVYGPDLEELIEACGDIILFRLPKNNSWASPFNGLWVAAKPQGDGDKSYLCADTHFIDAQFSVDALGETPEEALAELWLLIN